MKLWMMTLTILAAAMPLLGGCASQPVVAWQESLVEFIEREGGDPSALSKIADDRGQIVFHHIGSQEGVFKKSRTDMDGALVGSERIGEAHWLIFLVARVRYDGGSVDTSWDYPSVQEIRAAAMRVDDGSLAWRLGPSNSESTAMYVQPQLEAWERNPTIERERPVTRFPTERDRLAVSRAGSVVTVSDDHTGARWHVDLIAAEE